MDTSGFDTVARHIPLYRERLLALPGWVKDQAFDIHIASGQPLSLSGKEGALFLGKKGVTRAFQEGIVTTPQQLRELFLAACGHSVFRHEEELRQGYVRLGENLRVGVCGTAVAEGGQVRSLRDITALVYRIPRQVPGCGDRLFLEGVPLERGVLVAPCPWGGSAPAAGWRWWTSGASWAAMTWGPTPTCSGATPRPPGWMRPSAPSPRRWPS